MTGTRRISRRLLLLGLAAVPLAAPALVRAQGAAIPLGFVISFTGATSS